MVTDAIDLSQVEIHNSPDVRGWPVTLRLAQVTERARAGFEVLFDAPVPDRWKWGSNPAAPSENFQFTVWAFVFTGGCWHAAGFVQMWQGRNMRDGSLPAIFGGSGDGVPGYVNWWGDGRHIWGEMSDYIPRPGDTIGLMVSAGNARLTSGVTSVAERSQVVMFALPGNDEWSVTYPLTANDPPVVDPPPVVVPPPVVPPPADPLDLAKLFELGASILAELHSATGAIKALDARLVELQRVGIRVRL